MLHSTPTGAAPEAPSSAAPAPAPAADEFTHRTLRHARKRVFRLGLALNYGIDGKGTEAALERGVNYLFYSPFRNGTAGEAARRAVARDRERYVIATGPRLGFFGSGVRSGAERLLRELQTDYLDVFHLYWVGKTSALTNATIEAMVKLRDEGKVRAFGISIHDRERAGKLALESEIDLFMLRYNAAHPGAERDVFPHLAKRSPSVVAYTATAWRKLLKRPRGYDGPVMSAGDCYRFCLSSPHVDVALSGPASWAQLEENLNALEKGPLSEDEQRWMRAFGKKAHG